MTAKHGSAVGIKQHDAEGSPRCPACREYGRQVHERWLSKADNRAKHNRDVAARRRAQARVASLHPMEYVAFYNEELRKLEAGQ